VRTCSVKLTYPSRYFSAIREMYARNVYLRPPGFSIKAGDVVVDLGCNEGLFSVLAAKLGARVIAVDVQGGFAVPLREHLARNGCAGSVSFVHALVGAEAGLFANGGGGSHYTTVPPRRTMDEILADIDRVRLMKIDIEGSEFALFSGDRADWITKVD
jgi:FkbM family methyltransferase